MRIHMILLSFFNKLPPPPQIHYYFHDPKNKQRTKDFKLNNRQDLFFTIKLKFP